VSRSEFSLAYLASFPFLVFAQSKQTAKAAHFVLCFIFAQKQTNQRQAEKQDKLTEPQRGILGKENSFRLVFLRSLFMLNRQRSRMKKREGGDDH